MNLDEFGTAMRTEPFRPFVMHLADGREVAVRHPEMAAWASSNRVVTVYQPDGQLNLIDLTLVTDIDFSRVARLVGGRSARCQNDCTSATLH